MTDCLDALQRTDVGRDRTGPCALREAARQFEGLLMGMILKDSLRSVFSDPEGEMSTGMEMMRDVCLEKLAASLSETSPIGLADDLIQQTDTGGPRHV